MLPFLPSFGPPSARLEASNLAPRSVSPWAMQDSFLAGPGANPQLMQGALQIAIDQALLMLLVSYFERQSGACRSCGTMRDQGAWRQARPTSWRPSGGGGAPSSAGSGGGSVAAVDTRAPAGLDQLPQGDRTVGRFLQAALAQNGNEYEYGAGRNLNDADPDEFDCSGLVYWAMHQAGIDPNTVGSWSGAQAQGSRRISVDEALRTPGALLFKEGHVAISLGDGRTIEAMSERHGVKIANANGRGWSHGGLIPGMDYGGSIGVVP